jgi:hypothetical protein
LVSATYQEETRVTVMNRTGFAKACRDAVVAVLDAIGAAGKEREVRLTAAKLAVDRALHEAQSGDEWYLADHLRRGIKDVEARGQDAA